MIISKLSNGKATNAFSITLNPFVFLIMCFKEKIIPIIRGRISTNSMINIPIVEAKVAAIAATAEYRRLYRIMNKNIPFMNPNIFSV